MAEVQELIKRGMEARREHRSDDALRELAQAVEVSRATGDSPALAKALCGLAQIERDQEDFENARKHYDDAASLYRKLGDARRLAHTIRHAADVCRELHDVEAAERGYAEALSLYRADPATAPLDLANALRGYALLREEVGDGSSAVRMWEEAARIYSELGIQAGVDESERRLKTLLERSV